ncbi:hypothetical protein A2662_03790 [Candidatus Giovannonibacteria bacterium RIFCSPHIGHO2_01_FULL_45_33]|nr:MAG: hypothetical protein A2662_03790 [Candidatus Giovannonibacteria bacterium RIFCSPHIGHO2_01_FULL_45_33]
MIEFVIMFTDMFNTIKIFLAFAVLAGASGVVFAEETTGSSATLEVRTSATVEAQGSTGARTEPDFGGGYEISVFSAVAGKAFILDGSKSQDDGVVHTFIWRQVSGPFKFVLKEGITASFTPTVAGTYVFELVATDSNNRSTVAQTKTVTVTVVPASTAKPSIPPGDPDFDLNALPPPGSGDPDFDLLNIEIAGGLSEDVTVRGWDPKKKEEIVGKPRSVETTDDLKIYVEATLLSDPVLKGIKIKENFIEVGTREPGKFLWLIPVEMDTKVGVYFNPKEYNLDKNVKVKFPWWSFLVKKSAPTASLEIDIDAQMASKIDSFTIKQTVRGYAEALSLVSNVLKTRHDTVKNSIGNIR